MSKQCTCCYLLDAIVNGEIVRKMKYRREHTQLSTYWYDYNNNLIEDDVEILRLENMAIPENECDCHYYRDHAEFMKGMVTVNSIIDLPATKNHILVNWDPEAGEKETASVALGFKNKDVIDGDSFYIVVSNISESNADLYAPEGDNVVNIWGKKVEVKAHENVSARVMYDKGIWYWELAAQSKSGSPTEDTIVIPDSDLLVIRYFWTSEQGRDLDTATELINSGIPGADLKAVGWACPGNGNSTVRSIIHWAGDNTGSGNECIYLDMIVAKERYGDIIPDVLKVATYGTWYAQKNIGGAEVQIEAYKGGKMVQQGYNFVNEGGEIRYKEKHAVTVNTYKGMSDYQGKYTHIADIEFDKNLERIKVNIM